MSGAHRRKPGETLTPHALSLREGREGLQTEPYWARMQWRQETMALASGGGRFIKPRVPGQAACNVGESGSDAPPPPGRYVMGSA